MKKLKNWDNKTWLSSKKYICNFNKFLAKKIKFNKNIRVLDIGCGRANIISALQVKYKFQKKAIGIDIIKNNYIKKNIIFKKTDGISYLKKGQKEFDLILVKQTIHFFSNKKIITLLKLIKKSLSPNGKLLILSLKTRNNKIPCFKKMKYELEKSFKRDEILIKIIKKNLKKTRLSYFNFLVKISTDRYLRMIKSRYISCLLNLKKGEIKDGINELKSKYSKNLKFIDTLCCISFDK